MCGKREVGEALIEIFSDRLGNASLAYNSSLNPAKLEQASILSLYMLLLHNGFSSETAEEEER